MTIRRLIFFVAVVAAALIAAAYREAFVGGAASYAPAGVERADAQLRLICFIPPLCPVSGETRDVMRRAMAGEPLSEDLLGLTLMTGDGLPEDNAAGLAWIARAAEHGEPRAARDIAERLRNGAAIEVDETKIAGALRARVDKGDAEAMRALGPMIVRGRGAKQDTAAGLALLERAARLGSSGAEADLADLYLHGAPGVAADFAKFRQWLTASAGHGDIAAMVSLGYSLLNGPANGTSRDRDVAQGYCWLARAALLDSPQAQEKLSLMFLDGEADGNGGVIGADLVEADLWFRLAGRSPYHDNSQVRASIEPKMTTDEIARAKARVEQWRPHTFGELKTLTIPVPPATRGGASPRNCAPMA